jgi:hypothetical protein
MEIAMWKSLGSLLGVVGMTAFLGVVPVEAAPPNLAPGFTGLPKGASISVIQPDIELFSISAGGVMEPKADWTEAALKHVQKAVSDKVTGRGLVHRTLSERDADEMDEVNALHAAVAGSISLHHMGAGDFALPTKDGKLDWSLGDAVAPLRQKSGSDYALFIWMRDSYSSAERALTMIAMSLLTRSIQAQGGVQVGYASLVDLRTGRVLWFDQLIRGRGDLREEGPANETISALMGSFPEAK